MVDYSSSLLIDDWVAFVDFYSTSQAKKARLLNHNQLVIEKKAVKVLKNKISNKKAKLPLAFKKCEQLANHFLGFDGWRSEVLYHK